MSTMKCHLCGFKISLEQWSYVNTDLSYCECGVPYTYFTQTFDDCRTTAIIKPKGHDITRFNISLDYKQHSIKE